MKKIIKIIKKSALVLMAVAVFTSTACDRVDNNISVTGVMLDVMSLSLLIGDIEPIYATVEPENATNQTLIWTSSDRDVAWVDNNGVITAVAQGFARIFVTTEDGGFRTACFVLVYEEPVAITSLSFVVGEEYEVSRGHDELLRVNIEPENATDRYLRWDSDDVEVVQVTQSGRIFAIGAGEATVRAIARNSGFDGLEPVFAETKITVLPGPVLVSSVTLSQNELEMDLLLARTATLTATVLPELADNKAVTWSSNNEAVATVEPTGEFTARVTAHSLGEARITVTTEDGERTDFCIVTVDDLPPPEDAVINVTTGMDGATITALINLRVSSGFNNLQVNFEAGQSYAIGECNIPAGVNSIIFNGSAANPPSVVASFIFASETTFNDITFQHMNLSRGDANHLVTMQRETLYNDILFENCNLSVMRSVVRLVAFSEGNSITINNSLMHDMRGWGFVTSEESPSGGFVSTVTVSNSTLTHFCERFVDYRLGGGPAHFYFINNTFCNMTATAPAFSHLWRFESRAAGRFSVTVERCIFAGQNGDVTISSTNADYRSVMTITYAGSYLTSDFPENTSAVWRPLANATRLTLSTTQLFVDPANGNFSIRPEADFAGRNVAGDPRWWDN